MSKGRVRVVPEWVIWVYVCALSTIYIYVQNVPGEVVSSESKRGVCMVDGSDSARDRLPQVGWEASVVRST